MSVLVLSDIHANLEALEAVLVDAGQWDDVWFLGDAVGYGPDPNAVVERLDALRPTIWLAGNHDHAVLGKLALASFNADARRAAEWTAEQITAATRERLDRTEPMLVLADLDVTAVHASPRHPVWEYVVAARTAMENFAAFETTRCFFGHTHVPVVFQEEVDGALRRPVDAATALAPGAARWMINPGSVGQPRDGDPRASYALFDAVSGAVTFHRVEYAIAEVQRKMLVAGLPGRLAARLDFGL